MRRSIAIALATLISACSQSTPSQTATVPAPIARAAEGGPCAAGFVEIAVDKPACGIALESDGSLSFDGRRTPPIIVSYQEGANGRTALPAQQVILFPPSPEKGFRIVQACEAAEANSLCWAVRLLNPRNAALHEIGAGKYGPSHWVRWSPTEHRVALISRNEGAEWLHVVDTASGATTTYPAEAENANWLIDRTSFAWAGDNAFTVKIRTCETCAPAARSFTLP
ncbi:hypothetical protein [Dongia sedimenti]|uniref:Lipoprotein n=1 Tax=Dongia sedimenti TaxID=3064282 RepID=A0ABU0YEI1_9PROT|nr:hypothetical protein [Rhodospirillaceae bacterium R-7]